MLTTRITALAISIAALALPAAAEWPPAPPLPAENGRDVGLLPRSVSAEMVSERIWKLTFRYTPDRPIRAVSLAGSFNGWNRGALPMTGPDASGAYVGEITLGAGTYQYKFVIDDDAWIADPLNPAGAPDNHGGFNSVLKLGKLASLTESPGKVGDGTIGVMGLVHQGGAPGYVQPLSIDEVELRYRTFARDVEHVTVALKSGEQFPMHAVLEDDLFAVWEAKVKPPASAVDPEREGGRLLEYTFVLQDGAARVSDPQTYVSRYHPDDLFRTPEWARHAVWYQIMPDRFRNGSTENDPNPVVPWTHEWFSPAGAEGKDGQTFYKWYVFSRLYGGDLHGVQEKLPYLKELGVNAIYFNPVFQAPSHHKYDAINYLHVDEHLGGKGDYEAVAARENLLDPSTWEWTASDRVFLEFIRQAHAHGMKVVIDGVFNHVGTKHPAFQDVVKNGQASPYADWFDVTSWEPFKYNGWAGHDSLPVFRKSAHGLASDAVKKHIFDVTRRWMDPDGDGDPSDGIDGWRLDVPNEIALPFWAEWRSVVKAVNPDAYITGEIWDRADAWLDGRHFDAVMNYQFAKPAIEWIFNRTQKITPTTLDRRLAELRLAYPAVATYVMQNLVASHDTDRVASMALNPDRPYDHKNRVQDDNPDYNNAKPGPLEYQRVRLLLLLQMTYVGAPMIYYGDEVGMWGADDPTCRKPMLWEDLQPYDDAENNVVLRDHLEYFRKAIALRNAHSALRTGEFETLLVDDSADVWAFRRAGDGQHCVVILNASDQPHEIRVPLRDGLPARPTVVFGEPDALLAAESDHVRVRVPAIGGVVLHAASR